MIKLFTVDAFTDKPFSGNPAAVCILENDIDDNLKLKIASEMNLSETAFVRKADDGFSLRWFTPSAEVELCGHATLASAHILWQEEILKQGETAVFKTVYKGVLKADQIGDDIVLNFPVNNPESAEYSMELEKALGKKYLSLFVTDDHYLAEFGSETDVRNLKPDFNLLSGLEKFGTIVTAESNMSQVDFISRFFAPMKGINEDPVTGSAHCVLAPYWSKKLGKNILNAFQASNRGGSLTVELKEERVLIKGKAVTMIKGELHL